MVRNAPKCVLFFWIFFVPSEWGTEMVIFSYNTLALSSPGAEEFNAVTYLSVSHSMIKGQGLLLLARLWAWQKKAVTIVISATIEENIDF